MSVERGGLDGAIGLGHGNYVRWMDDGKLACRYRCGESFPNARSRGQHERKAHGGAFKGKAA